MRDTRQLRNLIIIAGTAALGAVIGEFIIKPALERGVGKR